MPESREAEAALAWLRSPAAIRSRCDAILAAARERRLAHFAVREERLEEAARYVVETIKANYPTLKIPYHSRWRHFAAGGSDRWHTLTERLEGVPADEVVRVRFDLVVTSVLLDAGAGDRWGYREFGRRYTRSEGLAIASFHLFVSGALSAHADQPLRADAAQLAKFDERMLADAFQAGDENPLIGLSGRAGLVRRLGTVLYANPELFGEPPRVGNLFDYLRDRAAGNRLDAEVILDAILRGLGAIWPGRITLAGENLGDVWRHPAVRADDLTDGLVPFHKLSQWLTYSLIEPLEDSRLSVTGLDALTALPEYRNGGLLIDLGVLEPKHEQVLGARHAVDSEIVVEWRALTVALIDRLATRVRAQLGMDEASLPLAKILEGGTWSAGRRIARERRPDGSPPIMLDSDGTVF